MGQAWRGLTHIWVVGVWLSVVGQARSGVFQCWVVCSNGSGLEGTGILLVVVISGIQTWVRPGVVRCTSGWYCVGCKVQGLVRPGGG